MREAPDPEPAPPHRCIVEIPACWHDLVSIVFPDDLAGITSEKDCAGADDPRPHYDDTRTATLHCSCGATVCFTLCSGQSNYFGEFDIHNAAGNPVFESEPLENFGAEQETGADGVQYSVEIVTVPQGRRPQRTRWMP